MSDVEVDRGVKFGVIEFLDHVGTNDAQLRCTMRHEGGHIEGAHADEPHVGPRGGEGQRAVGLVVKRVFRHDAGTRHDGQRLVEDAALGDGKGETVCHCVAADRHREAKGQRIWQAAQ